MSISVLLQTSAGSSIHLLFLKYSPRQTRLRLRGLTKPWDGKPRSAAARGCHCHCRVWGAPPRRCMELQLRESQHFAGVTIRWLHLLSWPEWISKPGVDTRSELQILNPHTMRAGVDFAPELNIYYYIVPGIHSGSQPFVLGV